LVVLPHCLVTRTSDSVISFWNYQLRKLAFNDINNDLNMILQSASISDVKELILQGVQLEDNTEAITLLKLFIRSAHSLKRVDLQDTNLSKDLVDELVRYASQNNATLEITYENIKLNNSFKVI
jgi:hypothetical protein